MLSSIRAIPGRKLQKGRIVPVHKNWAQNRHATAACDFCNRRNIPLQKCQDCIINICKNCTSQGTLQRDPRHMLASEAADSFEWHTWGKNKTTGALPSGKKRKDVSRVGTPEIENSPETALSSKRSEEAVGHSPPGCNFQYPPVPFNYPMPMIHNQQYNNHDVSGIQPVGFPINFRQYPQVPHYTYFIPPHGVNGYPAGQTICTHAFPQQPTYGLHAPQIPQLSPESSNQEVTPVPNGRGEALRRFRELSSQPEPGNSYSRVTGGQLVIEIPQAPQALPRTPVPVYRSVHSIHNGQPLDRHERTNNSRQTTPRQQGISPLAVSSKNLSVACQKPQTPRQSLNASEQAIRGSKRSREVAEVSGQGSSNGLSNSDRRPTKKPRHEIIPRNTERRARPSSIARASKRTSLVFEEDDDDDEDNSGRLVAKKVRRGETSQSRVVKVQVKSSAGVQRLREILGTPHAGDPRPSTTQNNLPSQPSRSHRQSTFSGQALKETRLNELLDAAGVQPVPWPAELVSKVPEVERSNHYSAKPSEAGRQDSMSVLPTRHSHVGGQTDDDEAREVAMILLSMRRGH